MLVHISNKYFICESLCINVVDVLRPLVRLRRFSDPFISTRFKAFWKSDEKLIYKIDLYE